MQKAKQQRNIPVDSELCAIKHHRHDTDKTDYVSLLGQISFPYIHLYSSANNIMVNSYNKKWAG